MTYRVAGLAVTATSMTSTYNSGVLAVIGITTPQSLTVQMNPTTSGTISNGTISYANAGAVWSSSAVDGSSTIELSEFNTATRKASGTFTATLQPFPGTSATGSKTLTDGTFTNVSF